MRNNTLNINIAIGAGTPKLDEDEPSRTTKSESGSIYGMTGQGHTVAGQT